MLSRCGLRSGKTIIRGLSSRPTPYRSFASQTPPPPPRKPIESTTFSERSAPRQVYERPEQSRGMPPDSAPSFAKSHSESSADAEGGGVKAKEMTMEEAFSGPSRPRMVYSMPDRKPRELPKLTVHQNNLPFYLLMGALGLAAWGAFLLYATNAERLASSVMRSVQFHLRHSPDVEALLGKRVRLEEPPWFVGDPWISGSINTMQGRVDLSFRIRGDKDRATVYFTTIRPHIGDPWRILRYKVIADSGEVIRLEDKIEKISDNSAVEKRLAMPS